MVGPLRTVALGGRDPRPRWTPRLLAFCLAVLLAVGALGMRLFALQVGMHQELASMAAQTRERHLVLEADRGIIYDRHGRQLVVNQPAWALQLIPAALPADARSRTAELARVARLAGIEETALRARLAGAPDVYLPITVKEGLDPLQAQVFKERLPELPGVSLESTPVRTYVDPSDFAHVLGYTNRLNAEEYARLRGLGYGPNEAAGKAGVEAGLEAVLRGRNGSAVAETNAAGLAVRTVSQEEPVSGSSVRLTIDAGLQNQVGAALQESLSKHSKKAGAAIVVNPQTGELLALVSRPTFDTNRFTGGISASEYQRLLKDPAKPLYDRALNGLYPPGSTFKMITAAAALQEGKITGSTTLGCPPSIQYGGWTYANWTSRDMGAMNVQQAIAVSCDTFFYRVADSLGDMALAGYARAFGYGSAPVFQVPNTSAGLVPDETWKARQCPQPSDPDCRWNPGETLTMGIGQSALLTTPLIQAMYISALANGGTLLQPNLVREVTDAAGRVTPSTAPRPLAQVPVSPANLDVVREGMRLCLADPHGTGWQFRLDRFSHTGGCKTGTAQYGGSGTDLPTHAWFTFFSPFQNPEIAIVVLVESGGEGDEVAEPVAVKIADYYYAHRDAIRA